MDAAQAELSHADEFQHQVVNDDLDAAVAAVRRILQDARAARAARA